MVIHLAQMIRQMSGEMQEIIAGLEPHAADHVRVVVGQLDIAKIGQPGPNGLSGPVKLRQNGGSRHIPLRELSVSVSHIARSTETGSQEVLYVAGDVEGQGAGDIGEARNLSPQQVVGGIRLDLASERAEIALEDAADGRDESLRSGRTCGRAQRCY